MQSKLIRHFSSSSKRLFDTSKDNSVAKGLVGRHFLTLKDFSSDEIKYLLQLSVDLKQLYKKDKKIYQPLIGKSASLIFQKRSTRTRVSAETAMAQLGGHPIFLASNDIQLGVSESVKDTSLVLSRFNDILLARVFGHKDVEELAKHSSVPVINGLSDMFHPLQILADFVTVYEHVGHLKGLNIAWVGDGNNVLHSIMVASPKLGMNVNIATPKGFEANSDVIKHMKTEATKNNTKFLITNDPQEAVAKADIIVTDTWVSMGQEAEKAIRLKQFEGYQVTNKMAAGANPNWKFLHCLPRYPYEVDDEVFYSKRSLVFDEAENRKWTVMAVFHALLKGGL